MRRVLVPVVVAVWLAGAAAGVAFAEAPAPTPSGAGGAAPAPAVPGKKVCTVVDERLVEISGMVATASGYIVVNDSSDVDSRRRVFFLGNRCGFNEAVRFPSTPRDPEDLALSADRKTLWIADIGDNSADRETVALWRMPADGSTGPEIFRMTYPDGARDAEALLIGADGLPVIITKGAKAELYKASTALKKGAPTPLLKVGELSLPRTTTANPLGLAGRVAVTGAAASPDGTRVVLRTYADAFEWDVNGDIVAALTTGKPRVTPLPDEPWGESITYSADGASFLTVSEAAQQEGLQPDILRYTPVAAAVNAAPTADGDGGGTADTSSFFDDLDNIMVLIGAFGLIGVLLVAAGVVGIVYARRRAAAEGDPDGDDLPVRGTAQAGPATEILARVGPAQRYGLGTGPEPEPDDGFATAPEGARTGGVYGGARSGGGVYGADPRGPGSGPTGPATGGVYGADPRGPGGGPGGGGPGGGGVYGGSRGGGAVYGGEPDAPPAGVYGAGSYRSGRDADDYAPPGRPGRNRPGAVYGGREQPPPATPGGDAYRGDDDGGRPRSGGAAYRGGAYAGNGYSGGAASPAGGYQNGGYPGDYPEDGHVEPPVNRSPAPAEYGYDDADGYGPADRGPGRY